MDRQAVRECLTGPIPSLRTPFFRDGEIDLDSLRGMIDFAIDAGAKTILLTAGDSHYECLSDDEIVAVTRATCEQTRGRAMVVAADRYHSTARAVAFAKEAVALGADVVMCMPPDWAASCTAETMAAHYVAVAEHAPVMIVTNRFVAHGMAFGLRTIDLALAGSANVVAVKDDMCGEFARRLGLLAHDRAALFAGGQKQNHMNMHPYGCTGYLSTFLWLKPEVAHSYWAAIQRSDLPAAIRLIADVDIPFFDHIIKLPGSFDAGMHAALEVLGLAQRWRRPPYHSLSDAEVEQLKTFLAGLPPV